MGKNPRFLCGEKGLRIVERDFGAYLLVGSIEVCMIAVLAYFGRPIFGVWWKDETPVK